MTTPDPLADPTGWFEHRYAVAEQGEATVPWDAGAAYDLLTHWAPPGVGRTAIVVGCGLGHDAEFLASLGYDTVAFDSSATAIRQARAQFPDSKVHYLTGDLLNLPDGWRGSFDLVVEIRTVQSLPLRLRADAIDRIGELVAPGGTLFVVAGVRDDSEPLDGEPLDEGPPWPLTRDEVTSFANETLKLHDITSSPDPQRPQWRRWHALFTNIEAISPESH
ncbi:class I SAM-dependent methyltransferase [Actinocrispum wychmicini]|uniref:Methyltransferase family protein n=1 Tax=Actinocrispum wychmicini TaxID=1213861 RepID=A0A4R2J7J4_9PSEU|nr:class I SAM-dependent methyltransferase [Actinocrispum wychmicini]TCO55081.1 methyltransferase family protein [Actinocrispum wychmicini]